MKLKVNFAASTPATPEIQESTSASVSIWRTMRVRPAPSAVEVPCLSVFLKREPGEGLRYSRMRLAPLGLLRPLIPAVAYAQALRARPAKIGSRWTIWPREDNHSGSQFGVRWPLPSVSPEPALH